MISITANQSFQLAQSFRVRRHHPGLVHHQHAKAIACLEELRRRRIMGGAISIRAHLLQTLDAKVLQTIGERRSNASMILMIAGAFDFYRLAVKNKSFVGVESNRANAESCFFTIRDVALTLDRRDRAIEI